MPLLDLGVLFTRRGSAVVEAASQSRDASGRGPREAAAADRLAVECPNRTPAIGAAMGSRVHEFRTAKLRRGSPDVCPRPGAARMIEDYYVFSTGF